MCTSYLREIPKMNWLIFTCILGFASADFPIVHIGKSSIKGRKVSNGLIEANQFLAIPYAKPPIGDLRFRPTVPLENLPIEINALEQPPACHQYTTKPFPWYANTTMQSEDCLYLNIWTPVDASPFNAKPVLFWIHGGSFRYGSIRQDYYDGTNLAGIGDIVVVTVNYRLGPFGFLTSSTEDAPGNAGLWDILEGLRWVHRNIRSFGGDPEQVTLAGESGGSVAVALLSVSPLSRGLYVRQIMESGSPAVLGQDKTKEKNLRLTQKLAGMVGCANESFTIYHHPVEVVQCLRGVDEMTITYADQHVDSSHRSFRPQVGDSIIPLNPRQAIANGMFNCEELLIGNNKDEGSALMTINNAEIFGFLGEKNALVSKEKGKEVIRRSLASFPNLEALTNQYLPPDLPESASVDNRRRVYTAIGDAGIVCPSVFVAEKCAEKGNVYYYFWEHQSEVTPWARWMGVTHFSEVKFVFGTSMLISDNEVQYIHQLIRLWTNFVKFGTPSVQDPYLNQNPTPQFWPLYSRYSPQITVLPLQTIGKSIDGESPHQKNCEFFRPFYGF